MNAADLIARWTAVSPRARAFVIGVACVAIVTAAVFGAVARRPHVALFAGALHPDQLAEVEERLAAWNVAFTPTADNVIVDGDRRNGTLLRLSLAGVPHAHVAATGEALSGVGALTPQAVVDAQTRAGLAGDIELGLRGIAGVDDAQVIVVPAQSGDFASDDSAHAASASVRLHLRDGASLSPDAVEGVRQFVAAGVAGLDPSHVTILDDDGVALGNVGGGDDATALQRSLQSALDQAFGAGAAIVRVRAERDPHAQTLRDVRRAPLGAIGIHGTDERYVGDGKTYHRSERSEDRGSDTRDESTTLPAGRIARVTAAVFVDARRGLDLAKIRTLAAATIGIDERRGDALTVQAVDFAGGRPAKKDAWWLAYGAIVPLLPTLAVVLGALAALRAAARPVTLMFRALVRRADAARERDLTSGFAPSHVAGALRDEPAHAAAAVISALPAATAAAVLEMYPPHERTAILERMRRTRSPLVPDFGELIERG